MKALNVTAVDICPWALRDGIILHYLQTRLNESLTLPLRPLDQVIGEDPRTLPWDQVTDTPHRADTLTSLASATSIARPPGGS